MTIEPTATALTPTAISACARGAAGRRTESCTNLRRGVPARGFAVAVSALTLAFAPLDAQASEARESSLEKFSVLAGDDLAETPFDAEGLGFTMRLPSGSAVRVDRSGTLSYLISEASEQPAWRMRAARVTASRPGTTAATQCEDYIADLKRRDPRVEVLTSESRSIAGTDAHLVYATIPLEGGGTGTMGLLAVPAGGDDFVALSLVLSDGTLARHGRVLDRSFATIQPRDIAKAAAQNMELLVRGGELIAGFTEERLRAAIDPNPRVYRMWKPAADGTKSDFGYMVIRVREGLQGEVDASKDPTRLKGAEAEKGLLASIDARVVVDNDPTHTVDAQSRYFVRWDRASEAWSVRTTERQRRASRSSAQTGLRLAPTTGAPRPVIQVITASRDGMTREPQEWPVPPSYLSQAELIVLGELLPRDAVTERIEFSDYAFDQREQKLPTRRETWSRMEGGWRLETQQGSSPSKIVQEFDAGGKRVRRIDIDGSVTERIDLEDLRRLWKSKGLPVD